MVDLIKSDISHPTSAIASYLCNMQISFSYDKKKVIQALRYHFVQKPEIRVLMILVNVFAIAAAVLFYMKKIRPEPFLLGSFIWIMLMASFWYFLPNNIYRKAATFQDSFIIDFNESAIRLENELTSGYPPWTACSYYHTCVSRRTRLRC